MIDPFQDMRSWVVDPAQCGAGKFPGGSGTGGRRLGLRLSDAATPQSTLDDALAELAAALRLRSVAIDCDGLRVAEVGRLPESAGPTRFALQHEGEPIGSLGAVAGRRLRTVADRVRSGLTVSAPARSAPTDAEALTEREAEVLERLAEGRDPAAIARELGLPTKAVQNHVSRILAKFQVRDRVDLVLKVRDHHRSL